ncbi:hypothetical protein BJ508DRAFT_328063 [Ascobolus immersus RN42]|uniref:Uncharacterized protein n=1 Tax=Ascobolus immersus RN42 TaxID=1160509 RepID=A0A3N4I0X1_ASCIM|nr:hypothetical protein BJ508DRAFT_328063 [Ascobolus immersus RN42]
MLRPAKGTSSKKNAGRPAPVKPTKPTGPAPKTFSARIEAFDKAMDKDDKVEMRATTRPLVKLDGMKKQLEDMLDKKFGNLKTIKQYKYMVEKAFKMREGIPRDYSLWMALSRTSRYDDFLRGDSDPVDPTPLSQGTRQKRMFDLARGLELKIDGPGAGSPAEYGKAVLSSNSAEAW